MIAIIDYGMGNLRSVQKGFEKVGHTAIVTGKPDEIINADGIVLPGVGAIAGEMTTGPAARARGRVPRRCRNPQNH